VALTITKSGGYQLSATVKTGSTPMASVSVTFAVKNPLGKTTSYNATTNGSGVAKVNVKLKPKDPKGSYAVTATATSGTLTGSAAGAFSY
jgi:hypothetical protein